MSIDNQINISVQNASPEIRNIEVSLSNNLEVEIKEQMNVQICQKKMRLAQNMFSAWNREHQFLEALASLGVVMSVTESVWQSVWQSVCHTFQIWVQ